MKRFFYYFSNLLLSIVVIYSVLGFFVVPYFVQFYSDDIIKKTLKSDSYLDSVHFNPYSFELKLSNFILKDQKNKNLIYFETFKFDLDPLKLLEKKIVLKKVKIKNLKLDVDIDKNEQINFEYLLAVLSKESKDKNEQKTNNKTSGDIEFFINSFSLEDMVFVFGDYSKKTPFVFQTKPVSMVVSDFSINKNYNNKFDIKIDTKNTGEINLRGDLIVNPLSAKGDISLKNINLNKIFNYIKTDDMLFDIGSKELNIDLSYQYKNSDYILSDIVLNSKELFYKDLKKEEKFIFTDIKTNIDKFTNDKTKPINITQNLNTPKSGTFDANITVVQTPLELNIQLDAKKVDIKPYESYIKDFANIDINSLLFSLDTKMKLSNFDKDLKIDLSTNASFDSIDLVNSKQNQNIFKANSLKIDNLKYTNDNLFVKTINIDTPYIFFYNNSDKTNNFTHIVKRSSSNSKKEQNQNKITYLIESINIKNGNSLFVDDTIVPTFSSKEQEVQLSIKNISSKKDSLSSIEHSSVIDKYASLKAKTNINLSDPLDNIDLKLNIENINLPNLSSYSGKYIGNKIANGKFALEVDAKILKGKLDTKNHIRIKDISLGEKVESKDAIDAPFSLAFALLEDPSGNIDLDIPIAGDINDPKFDISDAVTDVITNVLVGIVASPFKFLALIAGLDGEDISNVKFEYGKSIIEPSQKETLDGLIKAFMQRPNLSLELQAAFAQDFDSTIIKDAKYKKSFPQLFDQDTSIKQKMKYSKKTYIKMFGSDAYKKIEEKNKKDPDELYFTMLDAFENSLVVTKQELEQLAKKRVKNIKDYLVKNGLEENRITIKEGIEILKFEKEIKKIPLEFKVNKK